MRPGFPFTPSEEKALALDGLSTAIGSVVWPHPQPPLLAERAELLVRRLPGWSIATAHTAGWVYTGFGSPEPWALLSASRPALSPIQRQVWKPRIVTDASDEYVLIRGLKVTQIADTIRWLLTWPGDDEIAACQLYELATPSDLRKAALEALARASQRHGEAGPIRARVFLTERLWGNHPPVTR